MTIPAARDPNARFDGSIPEAYDTYLGPLLFQPHAADLARRIAATSPSRLLELACGTGILTRALRQSLPASCSITATDLNDAMITYGRSRNPDPGIAWQQADACDLPFADGGFDTVVCQFGLMFVPDKLLALRECRRMLAPGGRLFLSVWDSIAANPVGLIAQELMVEAIPEDPPGFYLAPFSMYDRGALKLLLSDAGFLDVELETVQIQGRSPSARDTAIGLMKGNPIQTALRERGITDLDPFIHRLTAALTEAGGEAPFTVPTQAILASGRAPR